MTTLQGRGHAGLVATIAMAPFATKSSSRLLSHLTDIELVQLHL